MCLTSKLGQKYKVMHLDTCRLEVFMMSAMPRVRAGEFDLNDEEKEEEIFPLPTEPATNHAATEDEDEIKFPHQPTVEQTTVVQTSRTTGKFFLTIVALSFSFISASTPIFFIAAETPFL